MLQAQYCPYRLIFKETAITSRSSMDYKDTFFVKLYHSDRPDIYGLGECALFRGLSADDVPQYEEILADTCRRVNDTGRLVMPTLSSMRFGFETAWLDLEHGGRRIPCPSPWSEGRGGIPINGLVWMGTIDEMAQRVERKIADGYRCIKFKIGGQDFGEEYRLLEGLRARFAPSLLEIRLDANGAFTPANALERLQALSALSIHSIEQPIKPGQTADMARLCALSPIPVALDEELIGVDTKAGKHALLSQERPRYIILKPSLCGGLQGAREWIEAAEALGIGWWVTSALESNVGLNMIAQWVSTLRTSMPQGLGTGALYTNNVESPLHLAADTLRYNPETPWQIPALDWR